MAEFKKTIKSRAAELLKKLSNNFGEKADELVSSLQESIYLKKLKNGNYVCAKGDKVGTEEFSEDQYDSVKALLDKQIITNTKIGTKTVNSFDSIEEAEFLAEIALIEQKYLADLNSGNNSHLPEMQKEVMDFILDSKYKDKLSALENHIERFSNSDLSQTAKKRYEVYILKLKQAEASAKIVEFAETGKLDNENDTKEALNNLKTDLIQLPNDLEKNQRVQGTDGVVFLDEVRKKAVKAINKRYQQTYILVGDAHKQSVTEQFNTNTELFEKQFKTVANELLVYKIIEIMKSKIKNETKLKSEDEIKDFLKNIEIKDPFDDASVKTAFEKLNTKINNSKSPSGPTSGG